MTTQFKNPFRPGAGHMPPYLAGRESEKAEFLRLLRQDVILENLLLTGLRGVGKTVLLETFKPLALNENWVWVGTDVSESTTVSEASLAIRFMTDISVVTSSIVVSKGMERGVGLVSSERETYRSLDYAALVTMWEETPGLAYDKLKAMVERVWEALEPMGRRGVIFAYDEAQNLTDHAEKDEYPLSLLLDVFQSIQRRGIPFMLALTGLPTLFGKLVEARTYSERMFHLVSLERLGREDSRDAIMRPIEAADCPVHFAPDSVDSIHGMTQGYPYFIQYVCREVYDVWSLASEAGDELPEVPQEDILRKLDADFFAGRWARATDRQRDLLGVIALLEHPSSEFTVQEVVEASRKSDYGRPFSSSHVNQMLASLSEAGLVYKNRWGKYALAVPLLDQFIRRQFEGR